MDLKKQNKIELENIIFKIKRGKSTYFLDELMIQLASNTLKKQNIEHYIFYPFEGASYGIIYSHEKPIVSLLRINSKEPLTHSSIMGSLCNLNIKREVFGDIIIDVSYYVVVMNHMVDYIKQNLLQIGKSLVNIEECSLKEIENYIPKYEIIETTASSERIDVVIAKVIGASRNSINEKFKNKEIILNYEVATKPSYFLKEGDIFSIRKYGKYKYLGIINTSKRNKFIIKCQKYSN